MSGKLILVPTPIGNLGDISPNAEAALRQADFIAAEDTRVSLKLLNHLDIHKPLVSYHEHNRASSGPAILERLLAGETCALVTDAGTPAISDPGEDLARLCGEAGVVVSAVPGPCAAITALAASGLSCGRFTFEGFLSVNKKSRSEHLASLRGETRTMIFYEAPHKLRRTLEDFVTYFGGDRRIALCRELTKLHEEILRMTAAEACAYYGEQEPRGEYVIIVSGADPETAREGMTIEEALPQIAALRESGYSLKNAVKQVSASTGLSRNELYTAALEME